MNPLLDSNATTSRGDNARGSQFRGLRRSVVKLMKNLHQFSTKATAGSSHGGNHEDGTRSRGRSCRRNYLKGLVFLRTFRLSHSSQGNETTENAPTSAPPGAIPISLPGFESTIFNKLSHPSQMMSTPDI